MHRRPISKIVFSAICFLWLGIFIPVTATANENETRLRVIYQQTKLSVEAKNVPLQDVLREISKHAGFTVISLGGPHPTVDVSFDDATLREALEQLLYGKNYLMITRPQAKGSLKQEIDKLFLLGTSTSVAGTHTPAVQQLAKKKVYASPSDDVAQAERLARIRSDRRENNGGSQVENDAAAEVRIEDLLTTQALTVFDSQASVNPATITTPQDEQRTGNQPAVSPSDMSHLEEALAITTRIAQQNLQALIKGLNTAGSALLESENSQAR